MKSNYFADYHVHTEFSDDSTCPMEAMVQRAIALGLDELAFTEHVDYGVKTDLNCDYDAYFAQVARLRAQYGAQIILRTGIEFGVQTHTIDAFEADFAAYPFDFVILSNHQVDDLEFWNYAYQEGKTQEEYQTKYYQAILEVMKRYKNYSVLGHIDMIKRYDSGYPEEKVLALVEPILKQAIADGKGIELNTSSFKYGLPDLMPSRAILRLYHALGGTCLTIGSDTHETEHLADQIPEVKQELRKIGFQSFCTYEAMRPIYHEL